jgi:hypothetical protein
MGSILLCYCASSLESTYQVEVKTDPEACILDSIPLSKMCEYRLSVLKSCYLHKLSESFVGVMFDT